MAALPNLITVAQLRARAEEDDCRYELHYGELVALTVPKLGHSKLQLRLMRLLTPLLQSFGEVTMECTYRTLAESRAPGFRWTAQWEHLM